MLQAFVPSLITTQRDTAFQSIQADPERVPFDFVKQFRSAVALMKPKIEMIFKEKGDGDDVAVDVFFAATALFVKPLLAYMYRVAGAKPVRTNAVNLSSYDKYYGHFLRWLEDQREDLKWAAATVAKMRKEMRLGL